MRKKEKISEWSNDFRVAQRKMKQLFDLMGQYGKQTQSTSMNLLANNRIDYYEVKAGIPMINKLFNEGILTKDEKDDAISRYKAIDAGTCPIDVLTDDRLRHMERVVNRLLKNIWDVENPKKKADKAYAFATRFGSRIDAKTAKILGAMSYDRSFFMTVNNLDDFSNDCLFALFL